jgi:hypothetical protein
MSRCSRPLVAAFAFLSCTALAPAAYAAPQGINNCRTITQPGSYVLRDNLAASGDCLVIQADFVTIDLDGFVIAGNGTGAGITDRNVAQRGITVRNGTIAGFFRGIDLDGSQGVAVERVRAFSNAGHGILAGRLSLVTGSTASENGIGISVEAGSTVLGNTVGRNQIGIAGNIGTSVINNTSRNNSSIGVSVSCPSLVLGNTATANPVDVQLIGGGACTSEHNSTGEDPNAG